MSWENLSSVRLNLPESWNFGYSKQRYYTIQAVNNKGADQTARMRRLICAFVVRIWHKQVFSWHEPQYEETCLHPMQTTKVQISLCICTFWSVPLLLAAHLVKYLYTVATLIIPTLASFCSWADRFEFYRATNLRRQVFFATFVTLTCRIFNQHTAGTMEICMYVDVTWNDKIMPFYSLPTGSPNLFSTRISKCYVR